MLFFLATREKSSKINLKIKSRESITWNVCLEKKKKKRIVYMENEGKGGWDENIFLKERKVEKVEGKCIKGSNFKR